MTKSDSSGPNSRATRGFTLAEILIAATLGALLLMATASMSGMFGRELGDLREEQDSSLEESLTALTDDVRYAWWAEVPNSTTLTLADPHGTTTTYAFRQDRLSVLRPDGVSGALLTGLRGGSFAAETVTRYREGTPATRGGTLWSASLPAAASPGAQVLQAGDKLALGFTPASAAPVGTSLVAGITEQLIDAVPTSLTLPLAAIAPVGGTVQIDLFRARAPNDARPEGSSLGTVSFSASTLPVTTATVVSTKNGREVKAPKNPTWGWWTAKKDQALVVTAPVSTVTVDLTALHGTIRPGYAYTLQIQLTGTGGIALATVATTAANGSGVALQSGATGTMSEAALAVARSLGGTASVTKALATTVVNRVQITLIGGDGTEVTGSVTLTGQGMSDDAWLGVVPGETEP